MVISLGPRTVDDDFPDHIGSHSATPSGAQTPQPDLQDKRLPGIMHQYFGGGQVGTESHNSVSALPKNTTPSIEPPTNEAFMSRQVQELTASAPFTAPATPNQELDDDDDHHHPVAVSVELFELPSNLERKSFGCPTPPVSSSSSSVKQKESDERDRPGNIDSRRLSEGKQTVSALPRKSSSYHAVLKSLPGIVTDVSVEATHFSPVRTDKRSSSSGTSLNNNHISSPISALSSCLDLVKLTRGVAPPRKKNTPPHTPRANSNSTSTNEPINRSSNPGSSSSQTTNETLPHSQSEEATKVESYIELPPTRNQKGKLSMHISRGRGLKPSFDPYVVCFFEWNTYITRGPKQQAHEGSERSYSKTREAIFGGVPIQRSASDMGRSIAIPMKSRQGSSTSISDQRNGTNREQQVTDPKWDIEATFDVLAEKPEVFLYVYDRANQEAFLGLARMIPDVSKDKSEVEGWFKLEPRNEQDEGVSGEIHIKTTFHKQVRTKIEPSDFEILKLIGKGTSLWLNQLFRTSVLIEPKKLGTFGQVYQVRKKDTQRIYAMKVLSKKVIVQKKEVAHTLGERNILVRTAMADSPFIVGLKFAFQTDTDLYFVTDFMSGGELFWHLQKETRFNEARAKFYIAELILALKHLHAYDIVYRDLKPENILLDANGHIALCDFGLSKMNLAKDDTTNTFCGTTEYLAPEVLLDEAGYTKMVDFWSLGVLVFEMCCGWSPFFAEDTQQMYKNIAFGKVRFPRDALSTEGRNFVKGLLNRNPKHRLGANGDADELKNHAFFADVDWEALQQKRVVPPFKPKLKSALDTSNFDPEFTNALANSSSLSARAAALAGAAIPASTPLSPGMQANFKGFTFVDESAFEERFRNQDRDDDMKDDDGWDYPDGKARDNRMSGIIKTTSGEDNFFSNGGFEE